MNSSVLCPFLISFVLNYEEGKYINVLNEYCIPDNFPGRHLAEGKFRCSRQWICRQLGRLGKSYRKVTNDLGKLPENWKEELEDMLVQVAYIIAEHNIPP